jgi:hypothetical protein
MRLTNLLTTKSLLQRRISCNIHCCLKLTFMYKTELCQLSLLTLIQVSFSNFVFSFVFLFLLEFSSLMETVF